MMPKTPKPARCLILLLMWLSGWVRRYGKGGSHRIWRSDCFQYIRIVFGCLGAVGLKNFMWIYVCPRVAQFLAFEMFSSFLEWVVRDVSDMDSVTHYLDDFLCVGPPSLNVSAISSVHMVGRFGVPLAADKTEGPTTEISFLGIIIDSGVMECRLPVDKVEVLRIEIWGMLGQCKVQLRRLQSGLLGTF